MFAAKSSTPTYTHVGCEIIAAAYARAGGRYGETHHDVVLTLLCQINIGSMLQTSFNA
jgi:hypothetical protein